MLSSLFTLSQTHGQIRRLGSEHHTMKYGEKSICAINKAEIQYFFLGKESVAVSRGSFRILTKFRFGKELFFLNISCLHVLTNPVLPCVEKWFPNLGYAPRLD